MKTSLVLSGAVLSGAAVLVGQMSAVAVPGGRDQGGVASAIGPDVIVGGLPAMQKFGTVGDITAYSIATTSCNIGDAQLAWQSGTNKHPVISQNMYRLKDGRFEMIGMSWLKHGFCALQQSLCAPCQPAGAGCPNVLGIGCSDPYSTSLNGQQSILGPRSQVNASTGFFPYPFTAPAAPATIGRRLQINNADVNPALNAGALYFAEGMYIHPDDSAANNALNNASWRQATIGSFSAGGWNIGLTGPTVQQVPAIYAWQQIDPQVQISTVDVPGDGRFIVAARVYDNGDGTWDYEYAVKNFNSHRSAGAFTIPLSAGSVVTDIGHHSIAHHSGEPYDTAPWSSALDASSVSWATTPFATNANANAIRWNTMFNFRFTADSAPEAGVATIGLFAPGGDPTVSVAVPVPSAVAVLCLGDLDGNGVVDGSDLGVMLLNWGGSGAADLDGSGAVDGSDLGILLLNWGACP